MVSCDRQRFRGRKAYQCLVLNDKYQRHRAVDLLWSYTDKSHLLQFSDANVAGLVDVALFSSRQAFVLGLQRRSRTCSVMRLSSGCEGLGGPRSREHIARATRHAFSYSCRTASMTACRACVRYFAAGVQPHIFERSVRSPWACTSSASPMCLPCQRLPRALTCTRYGARCFGWRRGERRYRASQDADCEASPPASRSAAKNDVLGPEQNKAGRPRERRTDAVVPGLARDKFGTTLRRAGRHRALPRWASALVQSGRETPRTRHFHVFEPGGGLRGPFPCLLSLLTAATLLRLPLAAFTSLATCASVGRGASLPDVRVARRRRDDARLNAFPARPYVQGMP